jgi:hypothetical protein
MDVEGGFLDVDVSLFAGCAVARSGAVYCWDLDLRELTRIDIFEGATKVTVGPKHACALFRGSSIKCISDIGKAMRWGDSKKQEVPHEVIEIP